MRSENRDGDSAVWAGVAGTVNLAMLDVLSETKRRRRELGSAR
jgi:hypothetical protein